MDTALIPAATPRSRCIRGFRTAFACAATFAAAAPTGAQNLQLYGTLDASVGSLRSGNGRITGLSSGVMSASQWGVRGSEDLGGGLRASFTLESGLEVDTGALKSFAGNPATATPTLPNGVSATGFNRRSTVGLASQRYGGLLVGRDYAPVFYAAGAVDAMNLGMWGNLQQLLQLVGGSERWARASNAVFYTTPTWGSLTTRAFYSFGSEAGGGPGGLPRDANRMVGASAIWQHDSLTLTVSHQRLQVAQTSGSPAAFTGATITREDTLVGARYTHGGYNVAGGYFKVGQPNSANAAWLGGSGQWGVHTVKAQVTHMRQDGPAGAARTGTAFGIGYVYALSKRTSLYSSYGRVGNGRTGTFGLAASDTSVAGSAPGASVRALSAGVRHIF